MRRLLSTFAITGCLLAMPAVTLAQGLPGLTLFSGVKGDSQLPYRLDFGGQPNGWDRYTLKVPHTKMRIAVAQFAVAYPDYYNGEFDTKDIEVKAKGKKVALQEVKWDKENHVIQIFVQDPIPAGSNVEIILSNVHNPPTGGMYYFNCSVLSPGDVPLLRYVGTWIIGINNS